MRRFTLPLILVLTVAPPSQLPAQAIALVTRDLNKVQAAARTDSNDAELQYYLALAHWQKHHWRETDSLLRLVLRLEPRFAEAYLALYYLPFARRTSLFREEERGIVPESWRPAGGH
jgi:hypothetical protein